MVNYIFLTNTNNRSVFETIKNLLRDKSENLNFIDIFPLFDIFTGTVCNYFYIF